MCADAVAIVRRMACPSCHVTVLDIHDTRVAEQARELGIRSVPAVVVDGTVAECCSARSPDEAVLRAAGVGQPLEGR